MLFVRCVLIFLKTAISFVFFAEPFAYNAGSRRVLEKSGV